MQFWLLLAIPIYFTPKLLLDELQVDGGVRKIVPITAAIDAGAATVYAIICNAPIQPQAASMDLLKILEHSLDAVEEENIRVEASPHDRWKVPVSIIRPDFNVHGTREIDPGLIKISMDYGYMRAFDVVNRKLELRARLYILRNSQKITRLRIDILKNEITVAKWLNTKFDFWLPGAGSDVRRTPAEDEAVARNIEYILGGISECFKAIQTLRVMKCDLRALIDSRIRVCSKDSSCLPDDFDNWWKGWERQGKDVITFDIWHNVTTADFSGLEDFELLKNPDSGFSYYYEGKSLTLEAEERCLHEMLPDDSEFLPRWGSSHNGSLIQSDWANKEIVGIPLEMDSDGLIRGIHGNFETLVSTGKKVKHYWRNNAHPIPNWYHGYDIPIPSSSFPIDSSDSFSHHLWV